MRSPVDVCPGLNIVSERDFLYPDAGKVFHPSIFAYIHKKDIAAFFELVVEGLKTPPEALEDERFDYLSAQEKLFCAKAFVYHLDNVLPRPEVPDHVEDWMATYVR